jgi:Na+/H+-dicarboxylate symporter
VSDATAAGARRRLPSFGVQVLAGMALGLLLGLVARTLGPDQVAGAALGEGLRTIGQIFVQLLKALVPPLVFTAIVASIAALRDLDNAARLAWRTLFWFAVTALIAVTIGIVLGLVMQPGLHAGIDPSAARAPAASGSWLDFLKGLVPANFLGITASTALTEGGATTTLSFNILQIIVAAVAVGAAAVRIGEKGEPFLAFNASALALFRRLLLWVIALTPIGTLPVTEAAAERLGVPRAYAAFAVPLGATTKMDGCAAIYPAIAAIFVAQFYGIALTPASYALIAFVSVIGSAATAGLTGATVMLTLTLSTLGLPLEGVGLLLAIDPILDMGRTAVNVAGQILVPAIVARREGVLDEARFDGVGPLPQPV